MTKKIWIDNHWFDEKVDGMTLVDAYYIPDEDLEAYLRDRNKYREKAMKIFKKCCHTVVTDFAGSQDGEAVIGRDETGEIIRFIHLDPDDINAMKQADEKGKLEVFLNEC